MPLARGDSRSGWRHLEKTRLPIGMATKKVTVTLDLDQLAAIRALVEARSTSSVSAFVQHAVAVSLNDVAGCGAVPAFPMRGIGGAGTIPW